MVCGVVCGVQGDRGRGTGDGGRRTEDGGRRTEDGGTASCISAKLQDLIFAHVFGILRHVLVIFSDMSSKFCNIFRHVAEFCDVLLFFANICPTLKFLTPVFFEMKASKKRRGLEAGSDQPSPQIRFSCSIGPILPVIVPFKHRIRSQHGRS